MYLFAGNAHSVKAISNSFKCSEQCLVMKNLIFQWYSKRSYRICVKYCEPWRTYFLQNNSGGCFWLFGQTIATWSRFAFIKKFGLQFPSCFFVENSRVRFSWNKKHFLQLSHSKVLGPLLKYIKQPQDLRRSFCLVEKSITLRHLSDNRFSSKNAHNLAERVTLDAY